MTKYFLCDRHRVVVNDDFVKCFFDRHYVYRNKCKLILYDTYEDAKSNFMKYWQDDSDNVICSVKGDFVNNHYEFKILR